MSTLKVNPPGSSPLNFGGSFASLVSHASLFALYELIKVDPTADEEPAESSPEVPPGLPPCILAILTKFVAVFQLPSELPPAQQFDLKIHLLPNVKLVNVRPYKYPYFQKNEIEKQVKEMLDQGDRTGTLIGSQKRRHLPFLH